MLVVMQFECGTRILRVIRGRDARATPSNCTTTNDTCIINNGQRFLVYFLFAPVRIIQTMTIRT